MAQALRLPFEYYIIIINVYYNYFTFFRFISFPIFLCFSISQYIHLLLYYNDYCIIIIYSYCYHKLYNLFIIHLFVLAQLYFVYNDF